MSQSQSGIVSEPGPASHFLVLSATDLARDAARIAATVASVAATEREVAAQVRDPSLRAVVSLGSALWDRVSPGRRPRELRPFEPIGAGPLVAPATGGDVLLHVHAGRPDAAFELARRVRVALGDWVRPLDEVAGFRYLDGRDLTGFIDGTENPVGEERPAAALIGDEDPSFAGGSYVTSHRYVHDLSRWAALTVAEQEGIVGRRKTDSEELADDVRPATSHVSRVVIEEAGEELRILRHSFPYGTTSEHGLFFIAYCRTLSTFEKMLHRMYGTSGDGAHDRLMEFTRAVSGGYFFAPSVATLRALAIG